MSDAEIRQSRLGDPQDEEIIGYQAISGLAVAGLIVGVFSPLALANPVLWAIPAVGIVMSAAALRRIAAAAPALVGRKAATVGLVVSVLCGALAPSEWIAYRRLVDWEARQFALHWFELLRRGERFRSHQLSEYPENRLSSSEPLQEHYSPGTDPYRSLQTYLGQAAVRRLLALGQKAHARYDDTLNQHRTEGVDFVSQMYAVTWQEAGLEQSFFIRLDMKRHWFPKSGRAQWQMVDFDGPIQPQGMGAED